MDGEGKRPARKTFGDLKYLCCYIESITGTGNREFENEREVVVAFDAVASHANGLLSNNGREVQSQWRSAVRVVRRIATNQ